MLCVGGLVWSLPVGVFVCLELADGPYYLRLLFVSLLSCLHRLSPGGVDFGGMRTHQPAIQPTDPPRRSHSLLSPIHHLAHCSTELTVSLSVSPSSVLSAGFLLPTLTVDPIMLLGWCLAPPTTEK